MNAKQDSETFPAYRGPGPRVQGATPSKLDVAYPVSIPDLAGDLHR
jgi:hypothetical protein